MSKPRILEDYMPFIVSPGEKLDVDAIRKLHQKVGDFRERFLSEGLLQDLLLNHGYELEGPRPSSYLDVLDMVFLRTSLIPHLSHVNRVMDLAIKPRIYVVEEPRIIMPEQKDEMSLRTSEGYDPVRIEELQIRWMTEHTAREAVRKFQRDITLAMDEFNMKFILGRMFYARGDYFPQEDMWRDISRLQGEINDCWNPTAYNVLDSAYYGVAKKIMGGDIKTSWQALQNDEFGKMFTLSTEESERAIAEIVKA